MIASCEPCKLVLRHLSALKDSRDQIAALRVNREQEGLNDALSKTVEETEEEKRGRDTSECDPQKG